MKKFENVHCNEEEARAFLNYFIGLPLRELRSRQDITSQQIGYALKKISSECPEITFSNSNKNSLYLCVIHLKLTLELLQSAVGIKLFPECTVDDAIENFFNEREGLLSD